jgi:hypothetical protein
MQEDKWSTQLGERLRKLQEEAPKPYLPGAWEAFEARRNQKRNIPPFWWWAGGIAASLALIFLVGGLFTGEKKELSSASGQQLALESQVIQEGSTAPAEQSQGNSESKLDGGESSRGLSEQMNEKRLDSERNSFQASELKSSPLQVRSAIATEESNPTTEAFTEAVPEQALASSVPAAPPVAILGEEKLVGQPTTSTPNFAEIVPSEAAELLEQQKEPLSFAVGLGPGFGNSNAFNQVTSGSRIGLGMQVDKALVGNLRVGSGLGVNYLSQASEGPSGMKLAGVNSPIERTTQVHQVQVDLPVYLRYSVTPSKSISVQAGFSNLLTFNQSAEQELVFTRQVAAPADGTVNSLGTLKSAQVVETTPLAGPSSRFLPFAQANLGVNVRVYENKKTSYLLMPFYSYPLQDISGTGQNPAVVGAAFKITFGTLKK